MNTKASSLPHLLSRVRAVGGMEAVVKLSEALGGQRVLVPRKPVAADHPLAVAGAKVAAMLIYEFGGCHTDIPKGKGHIRLLIARDVIASGGSNNEIAKAAGVTYGRAKQLRRLVRDGGWL